MISLDWVCPTDHNSAPLNLENSSIVFVGSHNHATQSMDRMHHSHHHYTNDITNFNKKDDNVHTMITVMSIKQSLVM